MSDFQRQSGWRVLRIRNFSLFFATRVMSAMASQMIDVAVGWLVYDVTHSAWALGLIGLTAFAPNILFVLVAGHVADRFDRRVVMMCCYCLMALAAVSLTIIASQPNPSVPLIFVMIACFGTARTFSQPASSAIVPNIVPHEQLAAAISISSSAWQAATIAGPAIGGFAYAFGANFVLSITSCLYVLTVLALASMNVALRQRREQPFTWSYLTAGVRYVWASPMILGAISLDLFAVLFGGATALLPIYARDILLTGPWGLGVMRAAPAVGAMLTSVILTHYPLTRRVGRRMFYAVFAFGAATILFGLSSSLYTALPALFLLGASDMVSVYVRSTVIQIETPDDMRGRVSAVNSLFIGASNELGEFESGSLAGLVGAVGSVVIGGVGTLIVAASWMNLFPALRDRDRLTGEAQSENGRPA